MIPSAFTMKALQQGRNTNYCKINKFEYHINYLLHKIKDHCNIMTILDIGNEENE